ncbi:MAG: CYTH and CHAD domain-containing protein [Rhizobiaceae bacterium]
MYEVELKFLFDEPVADISSRARTLASAGDGEKSRTVRSVYFDTEGHTLKKAGIALRIRRDGRRWVQTVKLKRLASIGLSQVGEIEIAAPGGKLALDAIPDEGVRDQLRQHIDGMPLKPICETVIRRTTFEVVVGSGTVAEIAVDVGAIQAGSHSAELREVEIELVRGEPRDLFDIARVLFPSGSARFSTLSKSARGYMLAETGRIEPDVAPRNAQTVALRAELTAEEGMRDILRECVAQILPNVEVMERLDVPEGPHQLRVGLRRLRSAMSIFAPVARSPELERLDKEVAWLAREVGALRDLDVAGGEIVGDEIALHPDETSLQVLAKCLEADAARQRTEVRAVLGGSRARTLLLDLVCFVETRGWLVSGELEQTARLAAPLTELSREALEKRWKKVARHARGIASLDIEQRHELRKELKKLRYTIEFFAPLYPGKRVAVMVAKLKSLQNVFGSLNDVAMVRSLLSRKDLVPSDDVAMQRAVGWILGANEARAETGWAGAKRQWQELKQAKPFWR